MLLETKGIRGSAHGAERGGEREKYLTRAHACVGEPKSLLFFVLSLHASCDRVPLAVARAVFNYNLAIVTMSAACTHVSVLFSALLALRLCALARDAAYLLVFLSLSRSLLFY
jgi:hypothetical protein